MSHQSDPQFMAQQLRKPFGEAAAKVGDKMNKVNEPLFDLTLQTMDLKSGDNVLEIGFGTGKFFPRLFANSLGITVFGIDYSNEMVDTAQSNNFTLIDAGLLNIKNGESNNLPFDDDAFDKVYSNMVIYFWDEPKNHLSEVKRVLKPGGKFYTGIRSKDSMKQFPFVDYGFNLMGEDEWITTLEQCNFTHIDTTKCQDPPFEQDEDEIRLESICLVAENA